MVGGPRWPFRWAERKAGPLSDRAAPARIAVRFVEYREHVVGIGIGGQIVDGRQLGTDLAYHVYLGLRRRIARRRVEFDVRETRTALDQRKHILQPRHRSATALSPRSIAFDVAAVPGSLAVEALVIVFADQVAQFRFRERLAGGGGPRQQSGMLRTVVPELRTDDVAMSAEAGSDLVEAGLIVTPYAIAHRVRSRARRRVEPSEPGAQRVALGEQLLHCGKFFWRFGHREDPGDDGRATNPYNLLRWIDASEEARKDQAGGRRPAYRPSAGSVVRTNTDRPPT